MSTMDPYLTPAGDLVDDQDAAREYRVFSSDGRVGRVRYFAYLFLANIAFYAVVAVLGLVVGSETVLMGLAVMMLAVVLFGVTWIFLLQRLHDLDHSGWWSLLMLVPLVNILFSIYVGFWPGSSSSNRFGAKPPAPKVWHWIAAVMLPLFIAAATASVAVPMLMAYNTGVHDQTQF